MSAVYPFKQSSSMPYFKVASLSQITFDSYIMAFYKCRSVEEFKHYLDIAKDDSDIGDKDYVRLWTIAQNMLDLFYE